jgi:hypothetical protein
LTPPGAEHVIGQIVVLSYHGWEIDEQRLIDDVTTLRANGWRDCSLADLDAMVSHARVCDRNYFHVTLDDGAEQDRTCVEALRRVSCAATLFISLDTMSDAARLAYRELVTAADVSNIAVQDHSLRHNRTYQTRHVIGFHSDQAPLMTSPDRLALCPGDPVCTYGGELARPRFTPDPRARDWCRQAVTRTAAAPGTAAWTAALATSLVDSGLGFRRLGRLCVLGQYESRGQFRDRIAAYLLEGRDRLASFTGQAPIAFAHPWWQPSPAADEYLRALGYRLTFSGHGLWRARQAVAIPRVFVSNETTRPLSPERLAAASARPPWVTRVRDLGRRALWA